MSTNNTPQGITPEVGKRYVTSNGWITPPIYPNGVYPQDFIESLISEYVEPTVTDTFRRDLIARLYVMVVQETMTEAHYSGTECAEWAIRTADTLIEAMEEQP